MIKIEVNHLTKSYKQKLALDDVSFTLDGPKIYGLLGRNGAGKTTFMEILTGHILASKGEILINGEKPFDNQKLTESICLIKEGNNFQDNLKIKQVFNLYALFHPGWDWDLAYELLDVYDLDLTMKVKALSKGMASALGVIVGLSTKAPITIFDEPYIGLDAAARSKFYELLLREYEKEPRVIIFSTHLIDEVSLMFEEVLILQKGTLTLQHSADYLRDHHYAISGPAEKVQAFLSDQDIIRTKELAGMMTAYVKGNPEDAVAAGFKTESVPIQELMIALTESATEKEA